MSFFLLDMEVFRCAVPSFGQWVTRCRIIAAKTRQTASAVRSYGHYDVIVTSYGHKHMFFAFVIVTFLSVDNTFLCSKVNRLGDMADFMRQRLWRHNAPWIDCIVNFGVCGSLFGSQATSAEDSISSATSKETLIRYPKWRHTDVLMTSRWRHKTAWTSCLVMRLLCTQINFEAGSHRNEGSPCHCKKISDVIQPTPVIPALWRHSDVIRTWSYVF